MVKNHLVAYVTTGPPADPHHLHALGVAASQLGHQGPEALMFIIAIPLAIIFLLSLARQQVRKGSQGSE
jgi:hypothetical protein